MIRDHLSLCPALLVALAACGPTSEEGAAPRLPAESARSLAPSNRVDVPATVRRNLGITFVEVEVRHVAQTLRVPGAFELQPLARHEYRMALPGSVQLLVDQYDPVEPGTPLFRYQSPAWPELLHEVILGEQAIDTARAEIKVGRAKLDEAHSLLALARERNESLARASFSKTDLEVQAAELEASLPRLSAAQALMVQAPSSRARIATSSPNRFTFTATIGPVLLSADWAMATAVGSLSSRRTRRPACSAAILTAIRWPS